MTPLPCLLAFILFSLSVMPAFAQQTYPATATIRGENIWLRVDPAEDTEIVGYLQRGDQIRVTGDATFADGEAFYPIEVVETGETGWVRDLAVDPRSFTPVEELPEVDVDAPPAEETTTGEERLRRNQNRRERAEPETVVIDEPPPSDTNEGADGNPPQKRDPERRDSASRTREGAEPRSPTPAPPAAPGAREWNCGDFKDQEQAQDFFDRSGFTAERDPHNLDQNNNGVACDE